MARTKHVYVRSDRIPPPGGWPAHVKVLPPAQPRARPNRAMQAKRVDSTVVIDTESRSEQDKPETDDVEDDGDVDSQDADEEDSAEDASEVETESESEPGKSEIDDVEDGDVETGDAAKDNGLLGSLSSIMTVERFLTERFDEVHPLTTEVAIICGVKVESLPSSLPPLFCASLARCSDFTQSFAERFPGVHLLTAEDLSVLCGVDVDSLPSSSSMPPIFRKLGRPYLYNASEAALLCGASLETHSSSLREEVAAKDQQRRRADATREFNAAQRRIAIASPTRRRSSRFQASVDHPSSSKLDSLSTANASDNTIIAPSHVEPSSTLLVEGSTLPSAVEAASPAMDLDTATFVAPITDYCGLQDVDPPCMDVDSAPRVFVTLWPHAMPLADGTLATAPHMSWESVAYVQCRIILLRLHATLRTAQLFSGVAPHVLAPIKSAVDTFWDFDNRLFSRIPDGCLNHNVHLLGSGLIKPPAVVIADNALIDDVRKFASIIIMTTSRLHGFRYPSCPPTMATGSSPNPAQFSLRCKILLRDDNAFVAWFAAYNSPCEKCSRAGKGCAKALGQPGCTGCIASQVQCSLQDTYLFEKTRDEFDGKRYEFDALCSVRKTRRRTTEETRRRTAARGPSSAPVARGSSVSSTSNMPPPPVFQTQYPMMPSFDETGDSLSSHSFSTLLHPHAFSPQTVSMPSFAANSVHGLDHPAHFTNQNIDPALLAPLADLMNTRSTDRETTAHMVRTM
ncbi:hypothetical protein C8F04DRAFT_1176394 [Mycena alexandri]|uniref:Uncharacterized protein n=1 Tax=Mycena alexandri TaxID=1745969 RepID=A0AAD6T9A6_9AGAR|nr:hypothetical protein C8F04DRAFT_1176394 [Mycena alexandri]